MKVLTVVVSAKCHARLAEVSRCHDLSIGEVAESALEVMMEVHGVSEVAVTPLPWQPVRAKRTRLRREWVRSWRS